jgi:hypothetical protein
MQRLQVKLFYCASNLVIVFDGVPEKFAHLVSSVASGWFERWTRSKQQGNSMTIGKPFQKGQSGNPGGRPKVVAEVRELARQHTSKAVETLVSIMSNHKAAPAARVSAANALLD